MQINCNARQLTQKSVVYKFIRGRTGSGTNRIAWGIVHRKVTSYMLLKCKALSTFWPRMQPQYFDSPATSSASAEMHSSTAVKGDVFIEEWTTQNCKKMQYSDGA